jgi:hypothetical protein
MSAERGTAQAPSAHQEALSALQRAEEALHHARRTVAYLEAEEERLRALCSSFATPVLPHPAYG